MKIDIRKLYALNKKDINEEITFPDNYLDNTDIIKMSPIKVNGEIYINSEDEIVLNATIKGEFILPCSITLDEVNYPFETQIDEIIDKIHIKNQFNLELLEVLWENTVLEVPMKVVKENIDTSKLKGNGWKLIN